MGYIALGVVAFVLVGFFDLAALRGWQYLKQAIGVAALVVGGYAIWGLLHSAPRFRLPGPFVWVGWPLVFLATLLLIYSLFVEIPFRQTYAGGGAGDRLVTTGTYALSRHPGVLWLALLLIALILVFRARLLLIAAPVWFLMDVLLVWAQDVYYLPRVFPGYHQYREETPMLVPTWSSVRRCWHSLRRAPEQAAKPSSQDGSGIKRLDRP